MKHARRSGTPPWFTPTTVKGWERLLTYLEKRTDTRRHALSIALEGVMNVLYEFDDLRGVLEDAGMPSDIEEEATGKVLRALEKRAENIETEVNLFDEQSDVYEGVNTLHSFVIGVIDSWDR